MKTLVCFLILNFVLCFSITSSKALPTTPKANDLGNHFGTKPGDNAFGPKANLKGLNLKRAGHKQGEPISPIENFNEEIVPKNISSGSLDNTSADASLIIKAPITNPKIEIHTNLVHNAIIKTPVHIGNEIERTNVSVLDRETGKVSVEKKTVTRPILAVMQTAREVTTPIVHSVDLTTGNIITADGSKKLLGQDDSKSKK
jgi:hypothetical protein